MKGYREEWFAVARTASKPDALQGFHAEHVLYIIDEASGVEDKVFEPILGALSTEGSRLFMAGNPTRLTGFFFDSHHKTERSTTPSISTAARAAALTTPSSTQSLKCSARTATYFASAWPETSPRACPTASYRWSGARGPAQPTRPQKARTASTSAWTLLATATTAALYALF